MAAVDRARAVADALGTWTLDPRPLHLALAEALAFAIDAHRVPPHLPSERSLASALHLSRGTVASAYETLRERGVLERERGSGSIALPREHEVCPDPIACVRGFFATIS